MPRDECICPRIKLGSKVTENRNLSPHCPVHGAEHDRQADRLFGNINAPIDELHRQCIIERDNIRRWVDDAIDRARCWEPAPLPEREEK